MKWNDTSTDAPRNKQEVLIMVNGDYYMAIYNLPRNIYTLRDHPDVFFKPAENRICWTEVKTDFATKEKEDANSL
jgi:hypothetical protein